MTDPSLLIRIATPADAEALADLGARTLRDTFGPEKTDAQVDYLSLTFRPDVKSGALDDPDAIFLIAEADGASIAYARLRFGYSPDSVGGAAPMEIARLYADAAWVGRGVGRVLMESCFTLAADRHCDVMWLEVWDKNDRAIAFYERWGFTTVGSQAPGWSTMRRTIER